MSGRRDRRSLLAKAVARTAGTPSLPLAPPPPEPEHDRVRLLDLAERLQALRDGGWAPSDLTTTEVDLLVALTRAGAVHGWPVGAADRLGQATEHVPTARSTDPSTSRADLRRPTTRNQEGRLLVAFLDDPDGLTSEEAAHRAGLDPRSEFAKRCSVLQSSGLLRVATDDQGRELTRPGRSGRQRLVFTLTAPGRLLARHLRAEGTTA
jgi:hypothetical protein